MGRKRSLIRQQINKVRFSKRSEDYVILYIDRDLQGNQRLASLDFSRIKGVTEWAIFLDDDDTVIPLHRIVEIRNKKGEVIWRRGRSTRS